MLCLFLGELLPCFSEEKLTELVLDFQRISSGRSPKVLRVILMTRGGKVVDLVQEHRMWVYPETVQ